MRYCNMDEALETLWNICHSKRVSTEAAEALEEKISDLKEEAEAVLDRMAELISDYTGISVGDASYELGFGGLCFAFGPASPGDPLPVEIEHVDTGGSWGPEDEECDE